MASHGIRSGFVLALFVGLGACSAAEGESASGCVFEADYYSLDRYESLEDVSAAEWFDDQDLAVVVTVNGDPIRIRHWSCRHYGLEASMYLDKASTADLDLKKKFEMLASIALETDDRRAALEAVGPTFAATGEPRTLSVESEKYSEFYVSLDESEKTITLTVGYYGD